MRPTHRSDLKYALRVEFTDCETGVLLLDGKVVIDTDLNKNIDVINNNKFTNEDTKLLVKNMLTDILNNI